MPLMISLPGSHSHLAEPSGWTVPMKPDAQVQSRADVDATGEVENSGHLRQAVPLSWPTRGLYVPS